MISRRGSDDLGSLQLSLNGGTTRIGKTLQSSRNVDVYFLSHCNSTINHVKRAGQLFLIHSTSVESNNACSSK